MAAGPVVLFDVSSMAAGSVVVFDGKIARQDTKVEDVGGSGILLLYK